MLGKAIAIAATAHRDQKDRGGNPYILHPMRMMMRLRTTDQELMAIAILHDVIEDSHDIDGVTLLAEGMSERVVLAVEALTHLPNESYDDYIKRLATNSDARRIKIEDLRDNSDITRLKGLRGKDFARLEKYSRAYQYLISLP